MSTPSILLGCDIVGSVAAFQCSDLGSPCSSERSVTRCMSVRFGGEFRFLIGPRPGLRVVLVDFLSRDDVRGLLRSLPRGAIGFEAYAHVDGCI